MLESHYSGVHHKLSDGHGEIFVTLFQSLYFELAQGK